MISGVEYDTMHYCPYAGIIRTGSSGMISAC